MLLINNLKCNKKSRLKYKRLGRGIGTGLGKTCGKGHKGQKSRSGCKIRRGFEGGQTPFYRRIPKFGFKNYNNKNNNFEVRLCDLNIFKDNDKINLYLLKKKKIIPMYIKTVKIILNGILKKNIKIIDKNIKISNGVKNKLNLSNINN